MVGSKREHEEALPWRSSWHHIQLVDKKTGHQAKVTAIPFKSSKHCMLCIGPSQKNAYLVVTGSELWEKGSILDWMNTARSNIRGRDRAEPKSPLRRFLSIEAQDIRPNIYKCTRYTLNRAEPLNEISGNTSCTEHLMGLLPAKGVTQWILFWDRRKACVIKAKA